jgi:hypothetical protein
LCTLCSKFLWIVFVIVCLPNDGVFSCIINLHVRK